MDHLNNEERLSIIHHKLKFVDEQQKPTVLFLSSLNPPVFESTEYLDEICRLAGGRPYHGEVENGLKKFDPSVIVIFSYAAPMEAMFSDLITSLSVSEWQSTCAVKENHIFLIDTSCDFRTLQDGKAKEDAVELLAEILYPQYFVFGMEGACWLRFEM